ncbi:cyclohexanone monooxygenase, partial [Pseudonocardia alaniniphila]|nr:cyclohexanone monooxygenase [Pseudonocardia alaniniphila]
NMPTAIEQHVDWISACLHHLRSIGSERIETTDEAADAWGVQVNEAAYRTLLPMAESSWYLGANVPGKPRVFMPYAGGLAAYARHCEEVAAAGYDGFRLTPVR